MKKLIRDYKKHRRKSRHIDFLQSRIVLLHNEIVDASFKGEFHFNKGITIIPSNVEIKAKLLRKYNRRLTLIKY